MSLTSSITINYPHADFERGNVFHMSTWGEQNEYTITEDGKLVDHQASLETVEGAYERNIASGADGLSALFGTLTTKYAGDVVIEDVHGDWHIWHENTRHDYVVRWNNGRVQYIRRVDV